MKWDEAYFIIHSVFVDDFSAIPTAQRLKDEFETLYSRDFEATGRSPMTTFSGLAVEEDDLGISLHLDKYMEKLIEEYDQLIRKKFIKPKTVPMTPGLLLDNANCPDLPDAVKQKQFRLMLPKVRFAAFWIRFDISYPT